MFVFSLSDFLSVDRFSPPSASTLLDRLSVNAVYYQTNYAFIVVAALLIAFTQSMPLALAAAVVAAVGIALFGIRSGPLMMNGAVVSENALLVGYCALSVVSLLYIDGGRIATSLAVASAVIFVHAALRKRSVAARVSVGVSQLVSSRLR